MTRAEQIMALRTALEIISGRDDPDTATGIARHIGMLAAGECDQPAPGNRLVRLDVAR